jgi:hypothetical protein
MSNKIITLLLFVFPSGIMNLFSQTYNQPDIGLKSHSTLDILKIENTEEKSVFYFSVINRITGGNFCADKNIFIIYPDGTKSKLISSNGIPVCPESYTFKSIGEKLQFSLVFPSLKEGIKWIDIEEECSDNCISLYGITLDNELNTKISEAVSLADKGKTFKAISVYKAIIENLTTADDGLKGALYTDIISLMVDNEDRAGAEEWYKKLIASQAPRLELYIKNLNSRGITF